MYTHSAYNMLTWGDMGYLGILEYSNLLIVLNLKNCSEMTTKKPISY